MGLENLLANSSFLLCFINMISSWVSLIFKLNWTFSISVTSHLVLTLSILCRWISSNHFPLSNLHESLIFLAWIFSLLCVFEYKTFVPLLVTQSETLEHSLVPSGRGEGAKPKPFVATGVNTAALGQLLRSNNGALGAKPKPLVPSEQEHGQEVVGRGAGRKLEQRRGPLPREVIVVIFSPIVVFLVGFGQFLLPSAMTNPMPLVPALQSNWLLMHVSTMLMSYGALISGCLLAFAYLISNEIGLQTFFDQLSYRMLALGFPLLTLGILSGSIWANASWGSFWSWDPKETWALANWIIFAIYLHSRFVKGWQGSKPAIIACFGFLTLLICFLGVNVLGKGLHNYSF